MKVAISLISSLLMGLMLKDVIESRGRLLTSVVFACMAFVFVMAAILLGSVDLALQYEAQGFFLWNAILGVATIFAGAGVLCALAAKLIFPRPRLQRSLEALNDSAAISDLVDQFAHGFQAAMASPPASAPLNEEPAAGGGSSVPRHSPPQPGPAFAH